MVFKKLNVKKTCFKARSSKNNLLQLVNEEEKIKKSFKIL